MGEFEIQQRTIDGFFNATTLLNQWNKFASMQKQMNHFTSLQQTELFINEIQSQESKERDSVLLQTRGKNGGTWMHPLLFIDFAMWLNPTFKYHVLKFVYDELIKVRKESGDSYTRMCDALYPFISVKDFPRFISEQALLIKNACGVKDWQTASEEQLINRKKIEDIAATIADIVPIQIVVQTAIKKAGV